MMRHGRPWLHAWGADGGLASLLTAPPPLDSINARLYKESLVCDRKEGHEVVPSPARIRSTISTITDPPEDLRAVAVVHKALADPTRLRILQRLAAGEGSVSDLMHHVDLSQPLVSWHLRRLRTAGLVETRRQGRETICSLSRDTLDRFHEQEHQLLGLRGQS
jgi:DNA-binding transcriptional ArsR family regulator